MADERNKIEYGGRTFTQEQIKSGNVHLAMSLPMTTLEANTFEATVQSAEDLTDFERYTQLKYYHNGALTGIFYIQDIVRTNEEFYEISATSAVGLLTESTHMGGIYTGQKAEEIIDSVCGEIPHYVKSDIKDIALYGWLPIATRRDNLMQVLFALGACLKTDLDGYLRIEYLWDGVASDLSMARMYENPRVTYDAIVTELRLTEHQYIAEGDNTTLFEGTAEYGDIITFNEPMHNLSATGFNVLESGANYARVSAGSGILSGRQYTHIKRQITRQIAVAEKPNIITIDDATLVSLTNVNAVATRLENLYKHAQVVESSVVYEEEIPGDVISSYHPYDKEMQNATLESTDITLSNTLKSSEKRLMGYVPLGREESLTYDHRELLTGTGSWTIPEGVSNITAVLISGGNGGQGGYNGENGESSTSATAAPGSQAYSENGKGGEGGKAGSYGNGGKVYTTELEISSGLSAIQYSCGQGGAGGESNGGGGTDGQDTTLTLGGQIFSTKDGSSSVSGYTDVTTGVTYAKPGYIGNPGANGGDGGNGEPYTNGTDGGNAGTYMGGAKDEDVFTTGGSVPNTWSYNTATIISEVKNKNFRSDSTPLFTQSYYGASSFSFNNSTGKFTVSGSASYTFGNKSYFNYGTWPNVRIYSIDSQGNLIEEHCYGISSGVKVFDEHYEKKQYTPRAYTYREAYTQARYQSGGGGAAYENNGEDANGKGGNGGDGTKPITPANYGNGGNGGNGGGGGGGAGGAGVGVDEQYRQYVTAPGTDGGTGGAGSEGGDGAPGCIILYYGIVTPIGTGQFVTKDGQMLVGSNYKRFIV